MIAYVDSSVLLRIVLGETGRLREWKRLERPIASELIRLECLRTVDRARLRLGLRDEIVAEHRRVILDHLDTFELVRMDDVVLARAADPFPTLIGSLDAVHLATALLLRTRFEDLAFATHDRELGDAAAALGFHVLGAPRR